MQKKINKLYERKAMAYFIQLIWILLLVFVVELLNTVDFANFLYTFEIKKIVVSALYFLLFYGSIVFFLRRPQLSFKITASLFLLISFITNRKAHIMGQPFLFQDLKLAKDAAEFVGSMNLFSSSFYMFICLIFGFCIIYCSKYFFVKKLDESFKQVFWWPRVSLVVTIFMFIPLQTSNNIAYALISNNYNTMLERSQRGGMIPVIAFELNKWETRAYEYNHEKIMKLRAEFIGQYEPQAVLLPSENIDVIIFMNESFTLPNDSFPALELNVDVTPNIRKIQDESIIYGTAYSALNGGGTCNVEYSFLTSYSAMAYNYTSALCYNNQDVDSMVRDFNALDFLTTGVHNFDSTQFYNRIKTFAQLGFENTYFIEDMSQEEKSYNYYTMNEGLKTLHTGGQYENQAVFMSDKDAIDITINQIDENRDNFIMSITMQNHAPFYVDKTYDDSEITFSDKISSENKDGLTRYFNGLYNTDKYMYELLETLKEREKPTIVVFYGDHAIVPSYYSGVMDTDIYEDQVFAVPYYIWANFDTEKIGRQDGLAIPQIGIKLQEMMGIVTDRVKIAAVFYNQFLNEQPYEAYLVNYLNNKRLNPELYDLIQKFKLISDDDIFYNNYYSGRKKEEAL